MNFRQTKKLLSSEDQHKFSNIKFDECLESFSQDIMSIYTLNNVLEDVNLTEIIKIPWIFLKIYSTQQKNHYKWSESSYELFARACKRLFEFTLYIHSLNKKCLNDTYLTYNRNKYSDLIDYYFTEIDTLKLHGFTIKKSNSKNHVDYIDSRCQTSIKYRPQETVQSLKNLQNLFQKFLLITPIVIRIYNFDDSKNIIDGRNPKGQWGKHEAYEGYETDFTEALIEQKRDYHSVENKLEDVGKSKFTSSPMLNDTAKGILGFQPTSENNTYKRVKIARAISANIAKQNQNLISDYRVPEPRLFTDFLKKKIITDNMSFEGLLFLSSLLLAVTHIELLKAMMGIGERIKIDLKKHTLDIQLKSTIFAQNSKGTAKYTGKLKSSQTIKTMLPENIVKLLHELDKYLQEKIQNSSIIKKEIHSVFDKFHIEEKETFIYKETTSMLFKRKIITYFTEAFKDKKEFEISNALLELSFLNTFFHEISYDLNDYTKRQVKNFDKTITVHINKLPHIHKIYLDKIGPETITERLFFTYMKKSEEVKMCYTSMPALYILQAEWYLLLQDHLKIKKLLNIKFTDSIDTTYKNNLVSDLKVVGSPFFLESGKAKNFFLSLTEAIIDPHIKEITKNCIRMIYIRYALSILLGTRDFHKSCDLQNYSRCHGILTIQEKAKDSRSAKRVIPLCDTAIQLIYFFHKIKEKYNYSAYTPCLLMEKNGNIVFETMTQNNITRWAKDNEVKIDTNFINFIPQNYGRHIIKSNTLNSMIKDEFIDAFLNHYSSGTEDQGIYSTFSNATYRKEIRKFMQNIATDYLPVYGLEDLL